MCSLLSITILGTQSMHIYTSPVCDRIRTGLRGSLSFLNCLEHVGHVWIISDLIFRITEHLFSTHFMCIRKWWYHEIALKIRPADVSYVKIYKVCWKEILPNMALIFKNNQHIVMEYKLQEWNEKLTIKNGSYRWNSKLHCNNMKYYAFSKSF